MSLDFRFIPTNSIMKELNDAFVYQLGYPVDEDGHADCIREGVHKVRLFGIPYLVSVKGASKPRLFEIEMQLPD